MHSVKLLYFFILVIGFLGSSCNKKAEISTVNVEKHIAFLSSDELKGRHAFGTEIEVAADYIANYFDAFGLQPLPGESGYRQTFTIYSVTPSEASIVLNNKPLDAQLYFAITNTETLSWNLKDMDVQHISANDDYQKSFRKLTSDQESSLIVVDSSHKKWFHRYRSFYSRPTRTFELGAKPNDVFVLYDGNIRSANIEIKNAIKSKELSNVAGMIEGNRSDEIVLFSAHYDHIGVVSPVEGDSIANGANDNASGTSGVIELARHFSAMPKPERTLYFVGFTAEETGGYGSKYFSERLDPNHIIAMFNLEMIGKPAVEGPNTAWITGFEHSTFGEILQNSTDDSGFVFYPDPYPKQNLFYRSDNATLARLGVPAHSISTTPIDVDQDYHRVTDELKTLDIDHTTNTIRAIAKAAKVIISGDATPTRIDQNTLN